MNILDRNFKYTPAAETDLRKTFARVRREQKAARGGSTQRVAEPAMSDLKRLLTCPFCGLMPLQDEGEYGLVRCPSDHTSWIPRSHWNRRARASQEPDVNFITTVPDHHDRIIWRNRYYHLDSLRAAGEQEQSKAAAQASTAEELTDRAQVTPQESGRDTALLEAQDAKGRE